MAGLLLKKIKKLCGKSSISKYLTLLPLLPGRITFESKQQGMVENSL